ncbi:Golgi to ER traffic- protein [Puccinia graminis f. sp. tritici]|uniref:Golgi to ER traffic-protein n=1 Tax=Puccinia graminis f. sp. tritici TaxID=56615 RepID=A0A5B0N4S5_PUCGR|nr:Golgi to ER traffic- protein [Puccinia graminis f. sp. tritici]
MSFTPDPSPAPATPRPKVPLKSSNRSITSITPIGTEPHTPAPENRCSIGSGNRRSIEDVRQASFHLAARIEKLQMDHFPMRGQSPNLDALHDVYVEGLRTFIKQAAAKVRDAQADMLPYITGPVDIPLESMPSDQPADKPAPSQLPLMKSSTSKPINVAMAGQSFPTFMNVLPAHKDWSSIHKMGLAVLLLHLGQWGQNVPRQLTPTKQTSAGLIEVIDVDDECGVETSLESESTPSNPQHGQHLAKSSSTSAVTHHNPPLKRPRLDTLPIRPSSLCGSLTRCPKAAHNKDGNVPLPPGAAPTTTVEPDPHNRSNPASYAVKVPGSLDSHVGSADPTPRSKSLVNPPQDTRDGFKDPQEAGSATQSKLTEPPAYSHPGPRSRPCSLDRHATPPPALSSCQTPRSANSHLHQANKITGPPDRGTNLPGGHPAAGLGIEKHGGNDRASPPSTDPVDETRVPPGGTARILQVLVDTVRPTASSGQSLPAHASSTESLRATAASQTPSDNCSNRPEEPLGSGANTRDGDTSGDETAGPHRTSSPTDQPAAKMGPSPPPSPRPDHRSAEGPPDKLVDSATTEASHGSGADGLSRDKTPQTSDEPSAGTSPSPPPSPWLRPQTMQGHPKSLSGSGPGPQSLSTPGPPDKPVDSANVVPVDTIRPTASSTKSLPAYASSAESLSATAASQTPSDNRSRDLTLSPTDQPAAEMGPSPPPSPRPDPRRAEGPPDKPVDSATQVQVDTVRSTESLRATAASQTPSDNCSNRPEEPLGSGANTRDGDTSGDETAGPHRTSSPTDQPAAKMGPSPPPSPRPDHRSAEGPPDKLVDSATTEASQGSGANGLSRDKTPQTSDEPSAGTSPSPPPSPWLRPQTMQGHPKSLSGSGPGHQSPNTPRNEPHDPQRSIFDHSPRFDPEDPHPDTPITTRPSKFGGSLRDDMDGQGSPSPRQGGDNENHADPGAAVHKEGAPQAATDEDDQHSSTEGRGQVGKEATSGGTQLQGHSQPSRKRRPKRKGFSSPPKRRRKTNRGRRQDSDDCSTSTDDSEVTAEDFGILSNPIDVSRIIRPYALSQDANYSKMLTDLAVARPQPGKAIMPMLGNVVKAIRFNRVRETRDQTYEWVLATHLDTWLDDVSQCTTTDMIKIVNACPRLFQLPSPHPFLHDGFIRRQVLCLGINEPLSKTRAGGWAALQQMMCRSTGTTPHHHRDYKTIVGDGVQRLAQAISDSLVHVRPNDGKVPRPRPNDTKQEQETLGLGQVSCWLQDQVNTLYATTAPKKGGSSIEGLSFLYRRAWEMLLGIALVYDETDTSQRVQMKKDGRIKGPVELRRTAVKGNRTTKAKAQLWHERRLKAYSSLTLFLTFGVAGWFHCHTDRRRFNIRDVVSLFTLTNEMALNKVAINSPLHQGTTEGTTPLKLISTPWARLNNYLLNLLLETNVGEPILNWYDASTIWDAELTCDRMAPLIIKDFVSEVIVQGPSLSSTGGDAPPFHLFPSLQKEWKGRASRMLIDPKDQQLMLHCDLESSRVVRPLGGVYLPDPASSNEEDEGDPADVTGDEDENGQEGDGNNGGEEDPTEEEAGSGSGDDDD